AERHRAQGRLGPEGADGRREYPAFRPRPATALAARERRFETLPPKRPFAAGAFPAARREPRRRRTVMPPAIIPRGAAVPVDSSRVILSSHPFRGRLIRAAATGPRCPVPP